MKHVPNVPAATRRPTTAGALAARSATALSAAALLLTGCGVASAPESEEAVAHAAALPIPLSEECELVGKLLSWRSDDLSEFAAGEITEDTLRKRDAGLAEHWAVYGEDDTMVLRAGFAAVGDAAARGELNTNEDYALAVAELSRECAAKGSEVILRPRFGG